MSQYEARLRNGRWWTVRLIGKREDFVLDFPTEAGATQHAKNLCAHEQRNTSGAALSGRVNLRARTKSRATR